ncbi:MAG TPA: triphosphoribosyl-dephospho-CoA synthase [Gemmataceae bacterium]|jgi:triphosphoribosyl-dephospho-CoA synthase|nr:triphosphoribosyl-dephospho-CoA synthase [Gemmataceae bacterium]
MTEPPSIGLCAQTACILDVTAFKPGNVQIMSGYADMTATDFLLSGAAIAPVLEQAPFQRIGDTILSCIRSTRAVTTANTNLGIVLLLAPLASVPSHLDLRGGVMRALLRLDVNDARAAYEAIRLARPGGLGTVADQDVAAEPTVTLREAMALAADRDMIARQYVNDFEQVFEGAETLREELRGPEPDIGKAVVRLHIRMLARYPDSLIVRKCGADVAAAISREARRLVDTQADWGVDSGNIARFGVWLGKVYHTSPGRKIGHECNPGTTADLVTASLFVALRQNIIQLPLPKPPPG